MVELRYIDRRSWPRGQWDDEPDLLYWESTLPCLIQRAAFQGVLLGYVGTREGHPWFRKDWSSIPFDIEVHGGITFSGTVELEDVPSTRELWWFGFDCGHAFDYPPGLVGYLISQGLRADAEAMYQERPATAYMPAVAYRDLRYVRAEVESLATQLASVTHTEIAPHLH